MAAELHIDTVLDAPVVDDGYFPSEQEEFMNPRQQMYFRKNSWIGKKKFLPIPKTPSTP